MTLFKYTIVQFIHMQTETKHFITCSTQFERLIFTIVVHRKYSINNSMISVPDTLISMTLIPNARVYHI
jgi:hypothetical protein